MNISPEHINTEQHFWCAFGNMETEAFANWIVRFCQQRGKGWASFTSEEIEQFYNQNGYHNFRFNRLLTEDQRFLKHQGDVYEVTPLFVAQCYQASPR